MCSMKTKACSKLLGHRNLLKMRLQTNKPKNKKGHTSASVQALFHHLTSAIKAGTNFKTDYRVFTVKSVRGGGRSQPA